MPSDLNAQWEHDLYAALFSCSPQVRRRAVAFRRTAAALWMLDGVNPGVVELVATAGRARSPAFKRARPLDETEVRSLEGLRVTSVARTVLDLGHVVDENVMERAVESALRKRYVSVSELKAAVDPLPFEGGTSALRALLARRPATTPPTGSDAETQFLQLARRSGLPEPQRQFSVPSYEGHFSIDFAWPGRRLAVEIDGAGVHASREALNRDLRRQNRILLSLAPAGWMLLRFTWDDVTQGDYANQTRAKLHEAWALASAGRSSANL
jgi:very-short-patch-repair endonuclease